MPHTRIMVVDDDQAARGALRALLSEEGFSVELAQSGASALRMVRENPPDIVLTDLKMPEMDGIALCRALHEISPDLPVIVITAFVDIASVVDALRAGAEDYLVKPLEFDATLISVQRAIGRRAAKIERDQLRVRTDELYRQATSSARAHEEVLSVVAHDLRNPLAVILMRARQLADIAISGPQGSEWQAGTKSILRSAHSMERLIADLLDESRIKTGHLRIECESHSLTQLLGDISELRPLAQRKQISIDVRLPERERVVICDRMRINQVLGNLIANAIKFSPEKSTISVFTEERNGEVMFSVRDEGTGIAAELVPRIFDRFWQSKATGRVGLGLGLYIVKGIVEAHGGQIGVRSQVGLGSTFSFSVPDTSLSSVSGMTNYAEVLQSRARVAQPCCSFREEPVREESDGAS